MNLYLMLVLIFAIGVMIFIIVTVFQLLCRKNNRKITMLQSYENKVNTFDEYKEKEKQVISSEKVKQIREKELLRKTEEQDQKNRNDNTSKNSLEKTNPNVEIRAGEVQRSEKQQFNLRKDEAVSSTQQEDEKWWVQ